MPNTQITHRACTLCEAACGLEIEHNDHAVIRIKGHEADPISKGHICPKAVALQDLHTDPDRLRQPVKKVGDEWQTISWDTAFEEIGSKLATIQQQHGDDAAGVYIGNPNVHSHGNVLLALPFIKAMNTRNRYSAASADQLPLYVTLIKTFGHFGLLPVPDLDRCDHMICLGGNPMASNGSIMASPNIRERIKAIGQRGQFITIDPRRTETSAVASEHIFIRPNGDAELLAAMLHILFRDNLVKPGALGHLLDGQQSLQQAVADFTPQRAEQTSGIKAARIEQLVQDFCQAKRPVLYSRIGACTQENGSLAQFLVLAFNLLCGRVDTEGGLMFTTGPVDLVTTGKLAGETGTYGSYHSPATGLPEITGEYPVTALADEALGEHPEKLRALYVLAGNLASSAPNSQRMNQAMQALELLVCQDYYISETSRHADYILPPTSPLERSCYPLITNLVGIRNSASYSPAIFKPKPDSLHDWQILLGVRQALLKAKATSRRQKLQLLAEHQVLSKLGADGMLEALIRSGPHGVRKGKAGLSLKKLKQHQGTLDLGDLEAGRLPKLLCTPDKRIKLAAPEFIGELRRLGQQAPAVAPEFSLIGRRHVRSNNSWLHNSQRLVKGKPRCTALIHPQDAEKLQIESGKSIKINSSVGEIEVKVEVTEDIMPGVISVPHGWSQRQKGIQLNVANKTEGANINDVIDDRRMDHLSGTAALTGQPVAITAL